MGYRPLPASYHGARRAVADAAVRDEHVLPTLSRASTADVVPVVEHGWYPPLRITALSAPTLLDEWSQATGARAPTGADAGGPAVPELTGSGRVADHARVR